MSLQYLLVRYGKRIIQSEDTSSVDTLETLYTVPVGKVFFLLGACLSSSSNDTSWGYAYLLIMPTAAGVVQEDYTIIRQVIPFMDPTTDVSGGVSNNLNPSIPIRVIYGEKIDVYANPTTAAKTVRASASIVGYEIDASLVSDFI